MPTAPSMEATKKVIVTAYEELPRRRPSSHGATTSTAAWAKTRAPSASTRAAGGYNRRALLLAYAQELRRRGGQQARGPRMVEWGKWKADPATGAGGDAMGIRRRRSRCSRFRFCVRLCIRTFLRRVRRIRENVSCKNESRSDRLMY